MDDAATPQADALLAEMAGDGQRKPWNHLPGREHLPSVQKVSYTHDAMIDLIIAHPMMSQGERAAHFGYTQAWVSIIESSDAFRARLEARKEELVDPTIRATIEERFRALATKSLEVLQRKLESPNVSDNLAIQAASLAAKSLGLGQGEKPLAPQPDRIERLGGRLLALLGERAVSTLNQDFVDVPSRPIPADPAPASPEGNL